MFVIIILVETVVRVCQQAMKLASLVNVFSLIMVDNVMVSLLTLKRL